MARPANSRLLVSAAALVLAAALITGVSAAGAMGADRELPVAVKYPVRWSAALGLESLGDLDRRQAQPLWGPAGILLAQRWRYTGEGSPPEPIAPKRILSCTDYRAADIAGLNTRSQSDHNLLREFAATCRALELLGRARPSRKSFVADFRFGEAAADMLPAGAAIPISPVERREIDEAEARGWTWRAWHESRGSSLTGVRIAADGGAVFAWTRARSRLEILARGDFNGDGVEDFLLRNIEWPGYAHAMRSEVFIVTRRNADAVLRLVPLPGDEG